MVSVLLAAVGLRTQRGLWAIYERSAEGGLYVCVCVCIQKHTQQKQKNLLAYSLFHNFSLLCCSLHQTTHSWLFPTVCDDIRAVCYSFSVVHNEFLRRSINNSPSQVCFFVLLLCTLVQSPAANKRFIQFFIDREPEPTTSMHVKRAPPQWGRRFLFDLAMLRYRSSMGMQWYFGM